MKWDIYDAKHIQAQMKFPCLVRTECKSNCWNVSLLGIKPSYHRCFDDWLFFPHFIDCEPKENAKYLKWKLNFTQILIKFQFQSQNYGQQLQQIIHNVPYQYFAFQTVYLQAKSQFYRKISVFGHIFSPKPLISTDDRNFSGHLNSAYISS